MWQSWRRRIVVPGKRQVLRALGFTCPIHVQNGLTALDAAFATGAAIWPWQSKFVDRPKCEDGLYNDYRVVHFHLGSGFETNGYINRTDELLFAVVSPSAVYEIGIFRHGDWYELDVLDIIDANWPETLDHVTIPALDVSNYPRTREEVKAKRNANVVSIIRLRSGRIIAPPGGGVATDGTSIEAVRSAISLAKDLQKWERTICANIKEQVLQGNMVDQDYTILLQTSDDEISGVLVHNALTPSPPQPATAPDPPPTHSPSPPFSSTPAIPSRDSGTPPFRP